jgi:hypothetical protein
MFKDMENIKRNATKGLLALHANELKSVFNSFMNEKRSV